MVLLISKANIEALNIDTVERAIVFGALCLEIGEQNNLNSPVTSIEISPFISRKDNYIAISFSCPLNDNYEKKGGGKFLDNLAIQHDQDVTATVLEFIDFDVPETSNSSLELPDYPDSFVSFEQYLIWYFFIYWASLETKFSKNISFDLSTVVDEDTGKKTYTLSLDLNLCIDLDTWLLGGNYIESVKHILEVYKVPDKQQYEASSGSILTNESLLDNDLLLDNGLSEFNILNNDTSLGNELLLTN